MINLTAYGKEKLLPKNMIIKEDRLFLNNRQQKAGEKRQMYYLRETEKGIYIKAANYIGTIQLSKLKINIYPRFDNNFSSLIQMLSFIKEIRYDAIKQLTKSKLGEISFYEMIVELLLSEIEEIIKKGAMKKYKNYNGNLKYLRGRVDFKQQLNKNQLKLDKIYCKYDELVTDIVENRIILKALAIAQKNIVSNNLLSEVKKYYNIFTKYCDQYRGSSMPEIRYNRLNYHYKEAHFYAELLIENRGSENIYQNFSRDCYTLLLDINQLIEDFITTLYKEFLRDEYFVKSQLRITDAITNQGQKRYRDLVPDIYLRSKKSGKEIIIDVKNENYDDKKVQNSDIYQLAFYGNYFFDYFNDSGEIIIIYPSSQDCNYQPRYINLNSYCNKSRAPQLRISGIDINYILTLLEDERENKQKIKKLLKKI